MSTFERLRQALARDLGIPEDAIHPETSLAELLRMEPPPERVRPEEADSLDLIEWSMWIEDLFEWGAEASTEDEEALRRILDRGTVQDLADFIDRRSGGPGAG